MNALARLLGIKSTDEIHDINLKFAAWWSEGRPVLVFMAVSYTHLTLLTIA